MSRNDDLVTERTRLIPAVPITRYNYNEDEPGHGHDLVH